MSFSGISAFFCRLSRYRTIPTFNDPQERRLLKTLLKKEKMLVTSIFSFSHNVFYPIEDRNLHLSYNYFVICKCFQFDLVQILLFGLELTISQTSPGFYVSALQVFRKQCGKSEIARNEQFLLFPVFSTHLENFLPFLSNLKLSSADSLSLGKSKICRLAKG